MLLGLLLVLSSRIPAGLALGGLRLHAASPGFEAEPEPTCTSLTNRGTHFTAQIGVGTPPQHFDVVADTGSDSVIVDSCICQAQRRCHPSDKCFQGTNRSSTFGLLGASGGMLPSRVPVVVLTFGSGQIEAVVATDIVKIGSTSARMQDGVLLMIDKALHISGPFEGILGLGPPRLLPPVLLEQSRASSTLFDPFSKLPWDKIPLQGRHGAAARGSQQAPAGDSGAVLKLEPKNFLETAGVSRFSMCFNDGADGVLRLDPPAAREALGSIGQVHWGLDFRGISVGDDAKAPALFCTEQSMRPGQRSPCGAIPDSGTTVMMGPKEHLRTLFEGLCDRWPRCVQHMKSVKEPKPTWETFQLLLFDCAEWMQEGQGLDELPPISLHLRGAEGRQRELVMKGSSYVLETTEQEVHYVTRHLLGIFPVQVEVPTGRTRKVCTPAFGVQEYDTEQNGPVWILGTPLFYEFQVGYDLKTLPPSISFSNEPCGSCKEKSALLVRERLVGRAHSGSRPRHISGPLRVGRYNTSLPL